MNKFGIALIALFLATMAPQKAQADYDLPYVGEMLSLKANYEDTFVHIARDYNLGFTELRAANPYVDPWLPGRGTEIILPALHILPDAPREGVVINVADMRIYVYMNGDEAPYHTPLGIGREGLNTPLGTTTVVRKMEGPTWRPTERMRREDPKLPAVVPPGDDNPMGTHALYLGWPQYAMQEIVKNGTTDAAQKPSMGCSIKWK